jgi:YVTN family beta-propeller protein
MLSYEVKAYQSALLVAAVAWASSAHAITAEIPERNPSLMGEPATFEVVVTDADGPVQIRWDMGDETRTEFVVDFTQQTHTYTAPGHYPILCTVKDNVGFTSVAFVHTVHRPLTTLRPTRSSDLIYDEARDRVYVANQDNDSVTAIDTLELTNLGETSVLREPVALALSAHDELWVLHREAHSISVLDPENLELEREIPLPYASQPIGLVFSPKGDVAYVTLMATGELLMLDPASGEIVTRADVGPSPRGVSVSGDGKSVFVTRFISGDEHGEVLRLDGTSLAVAHRYELLPDTELEDTDQQGRGLPNYLFSVGLSPDGDFAWIPGKKDNMFRGLLRDGIALSADNTVRPMIALLDLAAGAERRDLRIDLDDRNLPTDVEFTPLGDYAFVSVSGSALVEVRDAYTGGFVTALKEAGIAPRGLALTAENRVFVNGSLSRSVVVYDVDAIVKSVDFTTQRIAEIPTVGSELLESEVLSGKQLFFNSSDVRMSAQGYLSCASCHLDGDQDGRVWDFGSVGEGLRNTVSLLGRRGTGHGNLNWTGNQDEIQDAENNIRNLFGGTGFMSEAAFTNGTVGTLLGDPKVGLSAELDAIAAYVDSLDHHAPSPYRNEDGTLTKAGLSGRRIFRRLGCDFCHSGADRTDSARQRLHDVGTATESSGTRLSEPLFGFDAPTLNGVWQTAPYLHDGSAPTLRDVLTTANPDELHGAISELSEKEIDQLVSYVEQLDGSLDPEEADDGEEETPSDASNSARGGDCAFAAGSTSRFGISAALVLSIGVVLARRRKRRGRGRAR